MPRRPANRLCTPRRMAKLATLSEQAMAVEAGTPLRHMLEVMNDPNASPVRRDRMARAAAKYCHPRAAKPAIR